MIDSGPGGWLAVAPAVGELAQEFAADLGRVGVRDSKLGASSPLLPSSSAQWTAFLEDALAG
jgi:hypothetical protein